MSMVSRSVACFVFFFRSLMVASLFLLLNLFPRTTQAASISLVQHAGGDAGSTTTASLSFTTANTAGNWIAVCVRAGKSGQTFSVKDSRGNVYRRAVQMNVTSDAPNGDTIGIFYAENIVAGTNTVTVSDTILGTLRFAIFEYSGLATSNSLDAVAFAQGTGTSPNTGNVSTTSSGDLILGAIVTADPENFTAGANYVIESHVPVEPGTKLIAEDRVQTAAGIISANATLGASDPWGALLAAFRSNGTASAQTSASPSITSVSPTSGKVGVPVTISGANFGTTQGTSTVKFNGVAATPSSWSATSIVAPVPSGATTGNVVVTVGGVASNGVSFTVSSSDTTPPTVSITAPTSGATVSGTVTLSANASDNVGVASVQFQVDGSNVGALDTTSPYTTSWNTTTAANGTHTIAAIAKDAAGNSATSAAVSVTVSNSTGTGMGPLKQSTANSRYFINPAGNAVFLSGSHTWDDFQDTDTSGSTPAAFDFNAYVNFLKAHNQNATILWHKDLPEYCGWNFSGSVWKMAPWPWLRPGPGVATDGNPKFDLTQFDQTYFDRLRARVQQLQQNNIYAIVELFDGNQLTSARCSTDGYPYTGANNVNGVDDGYSSGAAGVASVTMTSNNAITNFQDAYVKKVVDTLNDLPNVIWEIAEEQPGASMTWWAPHMMGLVRAYEGGGTFEGTTYTAKAFQHPVGIGSLNYFDRNDTTLYASSATWVAPTLGATGFPENVPTNNQGKVAINDSDHSLGYSSFVNSDGSVQNQNLRGYLWENLTNGAEGVIFMDPYEVFWQGSPVRNTCLNAVHQICNGVDAKYDPFRSAMGVLQNFANSNLNLLRMTPQNSLASTGHCLADNSATGAEYVVYAPSGGAFTVNLSATTRVLNVTWLNPATGATSSGTSVTGGSTLSFTPPFSGDAVLYLADAAGHN
jgi:Bacterial Ig domain/IPT/TIG domain/Family of unknown function (DUF6298)/Putative collagen-binding domain of a collagenase